MSKWSPLHYLAALGAGGMVANFFMCLLFWAPHSGHLIPVFNNSLAQLLPSFTFTMIGVVLSAPAAVSHNEIVIGISYLLSAFLLPAPYSLVLSN